MREGVRVREITNDEGRRLPQSCRMAALPTGVWRRRLHGSRLRGMGHLRRATRRRRGRSDGDRAKSPSFSVALTYERYGRLFPEAETTAAAKLDRVRLNGSALHERALLTVQ